MKNFVILALAAVLCLSLAACTAAPKPTEPPVQDKGYVLSFKGAQIAVDDDLAPILEKLGEPSSYFESESCAFQGLDKTYTYGSVVIHSYPMDGKDYVLTVELKDDLVTTSEGICIGDTAAKVREVYGEPTSTTDLALRYAKGNMTLDIFLENDMVSAISYTRKTAE